MDVGAKEIADERSPDPLPSPPPFRGENNPFVDVRRKSIGVSRGDFSDCLEFEGIQESGHEPVVNCVSPACFYRG